MNKEGFFKRNFKHWWNSKIREGEIILKAKDKAAENVSASSWEALQARTISESLKNGLWTASFIIILVGSFIPGLQDIMKDGWLVLEDVPDWLQTSILIGISASFGIRGVDGLRGLFRK